ncbi:LOW QUALITY PROTEIN: U4/U6 small nuclear ribonucleoprotein Prp31 [Acridotheres tristis]
MSLVDELADLEEVAGEEDEAEGSKGEEELLTEDVREELELPKATKSMQSITKLWGSQAFAEITQKIEAYIRLQPRAAKDLGREYQLILDTNNLMVEIENELNIIHSFIQDKYSKQFLELESLVPNTLHCIHVKELGNSLDKSKNENVQQILANATIMVVSMQQPSEEELGRIKDTCDLALALRGSKLCIHEFVESCTTFILPSLSLILGASTAAKIMGVSGADPSKLPGYNLLLLGQPQTLSGFSSTSVPHTSFIYHRDIICSLLLDLRRKVAQLMAAKVENFHESQEGKEGYELKEEMEHKFNKQQEPIPVKPLLPALLEGLREKRGVQYRKMKEPLGLMDIPKQARMSFGRSRRMPTRRFSLGKAQVNEATKAQISKALQRALQKQSVIGGKSMIWDHSSGMASIPLQGLEIVNLQVAKANQKYFSSTAKFLKVKGSKNGVKDLAETLWPSGGFKDILDIMQFCFLGFPPAALTMHRH